MILRICYVGILLYIIIKLLYISKESFENPSKSLDDILADTTGGVAETKLLNATAEATAEIGALAAAEADGELEATADELNYGEGGEPAWAEDIETAEDAFYGQAKHAISGSLIPVEYTNENGVKTTISNQIGGEDTFAPGWVDRRNEDANKAMKAEDLESTDDSFSRNYALWKCIQDDTNCTAVMYARDGSKFALFKSLEGALISKNDQNKISGRPGESGTFTTRLGDTADGVNVENLVKIDGLTSVDEGGGEPEYDVFIIDSTERLSNEFLARNMREVQGNSWSGGNNRFIKASNKALDACRASNFLEEDDEDFECTVTSCRQRTNNNATEWLCKSRPRARLGAGGTYSSWLADGQETRVAVTQAETMIEAEGVNWYPQTKDDTLTNAMKYEEAGNKAIEACEAANPGMDKSKFRCYVTSSRTNIANEDDPLNSFLQVKSKAKPRAIAEFSS